MSLLIYPVILLGHLVGLIIDLAMLFIVVRLVCRQRRLPLLGTFDSLGRPLVEVILRSVRRGWATLHLAGALSDSQALMLALIGLSLLRVAVGWP